MGVSEGEAVEGGGATPDFVHQHQTFFRGIMQDVGGFGHFDHEGGTSAGKVVGCADAGEDLIQFAKFGLLRRDEAAAVREQRDECDLAHVGGFTAHIGTSDQQHLTRGVQVGIVGDELLNLRFHHRMASFAYFQHGFAHELRRAEIQCGGAFGKRGEHIQFGKCGGDALQLRNMRRKLIQQLFRKEISRATVRGRWPTAPCLRTP